METFLRRLEILNYLKGRREPVATDELIEHLHAAGYVDSLARNARSLQRLVQRDLAFLLGEKDDDGEASNDFGLTVTRGTGKSQLWQLDPYAGLHYDFERMPAYMALTLRIAERHLTPMLPSGTRHELREVFSQAEQKLSASEQKLSRQHYQRLTRAVEFFQRGQRLQAAEFDSSVLDRIYQAILLGKRITISYRSGAGIKDYDLHPYGVAIMLPKLYLVARKHGEPSHDSDFRSFLLHKMTAAQVSSFDNQVPPDFTMKDYLEAGHMDVQLEREDHASYELVLQLQVHDHDGLLTELRESPISPTQVLEKAGEQFWQLRANVKRTVQLRNWLVSLGPKAYIEAPACIQHDVTRWLTDIQTRYQ